MNLRKVRKALDHHDVRDFDDAVHFAEKIGTPLNTTITLHPGCLPDPSDDPWPHFVRLFNLLRIWLRRRGLPYAAVWVRENYARPLAEHLHVLLYVRPQKGHREALDAAVATWFPADGAIETGTARVGTDGSGRRINEAATYMAKQMTPQAAYALGYRVFREKHDRHTGDKVAPVLGKRYGLSQSLNSKARDAFKSIPLAWRPAPVGLANIDERRKADAA